MIRCFILRQMKNTKTRLSMSHYSMLFKQDKVKNTGAHVLATCMDICFCFVVLCDTVREIAQNCLLLLYPPPHNKYEDGGGDIGITPIICLSVCSSVHVSGSVRKTLLNCSTFFFYRSWYGFRGSVSCKKIGSLSSMSRSQRGLIWSKYDYFYYIY